MINRIDRIESLKLCASASLREENHVNLVNDVSEKQTNKGVKQ